MVKIGWSWEAKLVWFWKSEQEMAYCLTGMMRLPGCRAEAAIVQEWVDFDMELRLFFLPPRDWTPEISLVPEHHEYTAWATTWDADGPGAFLKPSKEQALKRFAGDEQALASAHEQAVHA